MRPRTLKLRFLGAVREAQLVAEQLARIPSATPAQAEELARWFTAALQPRRAR